MFSAFIEGYLIGLSLVVLIGPVLFVLVNTTLEGGLKSGLAVALGIFLSDIIAVAICLEGSAHLSPSALSMRALSIGGAILTLSLGTRYLLSAPPVFEKRERKVHIIGLYKPLIRGFAVNFINPFVFLVWMGIIAFAKERTAESGALIIYLFATLLGILSLDVSKAVFAERLLPTLAPKRLGDIMKGSGAILILFGLRLLFSLSE